MVVKFDLGDERSMADTSKQRCEVLGDTVDHKRVIFISHSENVSRVLTIGTSRASSTRPRHIDTNRITCHALDRLDHGELQQGEDSDVAIVASCDDPVFSPVGADAERDDVVDGADVEAHDQVGVNV